MAKSLKYATIEEYIDDQSSEAQVLLRDLKSIIGAEYGRPLVFIRFPNSHSFRAGRAAFLLFGRALPTNNGYSFRSGIDQR